MTDPKSGFLYSWMDRPPCGRDRETIRWPRRILAWTLSGPPSATRYESLPAIHLAALGVLLHGARILRKALLRFPRRRDRPGLTCTSRLEDLTPYANRVMATARKPTIANLIALQPSPGSRQFTHCFLLRRLHQPSIILSARSRDDLFVSCDVSTMPFPACPLSWVLVAVLRGDGPQIPGTVSRTTWNRLVSWS